jgi:hypothetical protein
MKKILVATVVLLASTFLTQAQVRIGVKAGTNLSSQYRGDVGGSELFSLHAFKGYHVGLVAETQLLKNVYLQPQLLFTHKGAKLNNFEGSYAKIKMNYIDMPVNLVYKIPVSFGKLFGGAGPVISYGFGGKIEQNGQSNKLFATNNWKHLDISANATAGIELNNGLFGSVSYQRGMKDIYKGDINVKNRSISVSVGYMLPWKSRKG